MEGGAVAMECAGVPQAATRCRRDQGVIVGRAGTVRRSAGVRCTMLMAALQGKTTNSSQNVKNLLRNHLLGPARPTFWRAAEFISAVRTAGMNPAARQRIGYAGPSNQRQQ